MSRFHRDVADESMDVSDREADAMAQELAGDVEPMEESRTICGKQ